MTPVNGKAAGMNDSDSLRIFGEGFYQVMNAKLGHWALPVHTTLPKFDGGGDFAILIYQLKLCFCSWSHIAHAAGFVHVTEKPCQSLVFGRCRESTIFLLIHPYGGAALVANKHRRMIRVSPIRSSLHTSCHNVQEIASKGNRDIVT